MSNSRIIIDNRNDAQYQAILKMVLQNAIQGHPEKDNFSITEKDGAHRWDIHTHMVSNKNHPLNLFFTCYAVQLIHQKQVTEVFFTPDDSKTIWATIIGKNSIESIEPPSPRPAFKR